MVWEVAIKSIRINYQNPQKREKLMINVANTAFDSALESRMATP